MRTLSCHFVARQGQLVSPLANLRAKRQANPDVLVLNVQIRLKYSGTFTRTGLSARADPGLEERANMHAPLTNSARPHSLAQINNTVFSVFPHLVHKIFSRLEFAPPPQIWCGIPLTSILDLHNHASFRRHLHKSLFKYVCA